MQCPCKAPGPQRHPPATPIQAHVSPPCKPHASFIHAICHKKHVSCKQIWLKSMQKSPKQKHAKQQKHLYSYALAAQHMLTAVCTISGRKMRSRRLVWGLHGGRGLARLHGAGIRVQGLHGGTKEECTGVAWGDQGGMHGGCMGGPRRNARGLHGGTKEECTGVAWGDQGGMHGGWQNPKP